MTTHPTEKTIAEDLVRYLRDNAGICADVSVNAFSMPWIRYCDGEWQRAEYEELNRVASRVMDEEGVVKVFAQNPVNLVPVTEAYRTPSKEETVWEEAERQDAFTDADRCFWCGVSENDSDLELYETVEDGDCLLCPSCYESWEKAGEIVSRAL